MNTILITVDALRADHLNQYGYERDTIPVLDRLLDDGVIFKNAFSNAPYTRISIPAIHSSVRLAHTLEQLPTIANELGNAGMTTACIGTRTGFKSAEGDLHFDTYVTLGRDEYHEESKSSKSLPVRIRDGILSTVGSVIEPYPRVHNIAKTAYNSIPSSNSGFSYKGYTSAKDVTDTTIDWLNQHSNEDFFLWLHYMEGHRPYGVHNDNPEYTTFVPNDRIRELMKKAGTKPDKVTTTERKLLVDLYDSDLRYFSDHLGRLFDRLEELELWEDSNIIFTSDHGEEFYDHGEYFHRNLPYDKNIHVPLLVRDTDTSTNKNKIASQRELIDVGPTILDLHGLTPPATFEGEHLYSDTSRKIIATGSQQEQDPVVAGRWDGFKYIYTSNHWYLFDLTDDPLENHNLADEQPDLCIEYRETIPDKYFSEDNEEKLREPDNKVDKKRLEALGYLETKE